MNNENFENDPGIQRLLRRVEVYKAKEEARASAIRAEVEAGWAQAARLRSARSRITGRILRLEASLRRKLVRVQVRTGKLKLLNQKMAQRRAYLAQRQERQLKLQAGQEAIRLWRMEHRLPSTGLTGTNPIG
jgi:hypothetical protein